MKDDGEVAEMKGEATREGGGEQMSHDPLLQGSAGGVRQTKDPVSM